MQAVNILGVNISKIGLSDAASYILERTSRKEKTLVFTPNAEALFLCSDNKAVLDAFRSADLCVPDGDGVLLASRLVKDPITTGKVAGVELGELLCSRAAADPSASHSFFFFGGKPGVAEKAASALCLKYPGLKIAGCLDGYLPDDAAGEVIKRINESGADILFVCLGMPKQEIFSASNRDILLPQTILCLGGSLDIYSGTAKRAPRFFISLHLEWLWRFFRYPGRLSRFLRIPRFLVRVIKNKTVDA